MPLPLRVSTTPRACQCRIASRMVERPTDSSAINSRSVGKQSPGWRSERSMYSATARIAPDERADVTWRV